MEILVETSTVAEDTEPQWLISLREKVPQPPYCGADVATDKIFGGDVTEINEFGWTVLLEYEKRE